MAEPKCPKCDAEGVGNIALKKTPLQGGTPFRKDIYEVIFCTQCGHIYGVFPEP